METISGPGVTWTDVVSPKREDIVALGKDHPFHPLNLDDCLSKRQLPKVDDYSDHVYMLLQFPVRDEKTGLIRGSQISMFLGKDFFVTVRDPDLQSVSVLFNSLQDDERRRSAYMKSSTQLFYHLIDGLVNDLFPLLKEIRGDLDDIEDRVFDSRVSVAKELMRLRRIIGDVRRSVAPLRRLFLDLTVAVNRFADENLSKYFGDVRDHIEKAWAVLEEGNETIEIYKDTDYVLSSELTNKVLAILTVAFTLTIPATVVASIYGMNVPLPGGLAAGPWTFLGPFTTFYILMLFSFVPAAIMIVFFRRRGWL